MARSGFTSTAFLSMASALYQNAGPKTIGAWVKPASSKTQTILSCYTTANRSCLSLILAGLTPELGVVATSNSAGAVASAAGTVNTWFHAAGTHDGSGGTLIVYKDGANAGSQSSLGVNPSTFTKTCISFDPVGGTQTFGAAFDGLIAEAGVWNAVLTTAELAMLAKGASPLLVRPSALIAYYPLIGANSPENNLKATGAMTLTGSPTKAAHPRIFMPPKRRLVA